MLFSATLPIAGPAAPLSASAPRIGAPRPPAAAPPPAAPTGDFPDWAYPDCPKSSHGTTADDGRPLRIPKSALAFTAAQIADWSVTRDWFPEEHSALPTVLAISGRTAIAACGYCHLPDGGGRPENVKLAGLPAGYIIAQVTALRAGVRGAARPDWAPTTLMRQATADLTEAQIAEAADYFSHQRTRSFVRIVESTRVPRQHLGCFLFLPSGGASVPLGARILEMPTDVERFERRDPHVSYLAYVPAGSIDRGRVLAATGGHGRTQPCAGCHGRGLTGGPHWYGPPLAGRFPGYLFRQLYNFRSGARGGNAAGPMQTVVAGLTQADMIDLAAYAAALPP